MPLGDWTGQRQTRSKIARGEILDAPYISPSIIADRNDTKGDDGHWSVGEN
jgi:hypothetical protein